MKTKAKKKVVRGKISINTTAARNDLDLLKALIEKYKWKEVHIRDKKADVQWLYPTEKA